MKRIGMLGVSVREMKALTEDSDSDSDTECDRHPLCTKCVKLVV